MNEQKSKTWDEFETEWEKLIEEMKQKLSPDDPLRVFLCLDNIKSPDQP